ncbi:FACT complex subunit SPT16-like [Impatiens glandulifera]|uniref:FACT complex subunit SPT16-like n=1 Tax=Impatiens glandulifera TaxID=253017 RepID=UPI001FB16B33|nr:FACT complex subunit SPT16-like [Impatiens glandulifera]
MPEERNNGNAKATNGKPAVGASAYAINLESFSNRLKMLYKHWNDYKSDLWGDSDVLAIATPPPSEDLRYLKSSALNIWLLGYEFPDTIMVFMKKEIHFLCSQKKSSLLEGIKKASKDSVGAEVIMHVKSKTDDGTKLMDSIFSTVHALSKSEGRDTPIVGYIARELPEGNLLELWTKKLNSANFQLNDISNGFSDLFAVKDSVEITNVKKAAYLTSSVMKHFVVPKIEKVIDEEKKVSHSSLMDDTEKVILEPSKINVKLKAENIDICYPPIFQSGGEFDLKPSASSNDDNLYYDSTSVIICAIGSRYNSYCSNVARTYLFDANAMQIKAYEVLLKAQEASIAALKPGNKASAAFQAAISIVEKDAPEFLPNLTKSAGIGMGLEFRESGLSLNAKNDRVLKPGMIFNVSLGLQNLETETKNSKTKKFSLLLADTVVVAGDSSQVMTSLCSKSLKDVSYSFNEDDEEEEQQPKVKTNVNASKSSLPSKATLRSVNNEMSKEELRRQHQAELARQKNEETARRLAGAGSGLGNSRGSDRPSGELVSYKNVNDIPPPRDFMIQIDQKNEAILLPIQGSMVPFHVAMVKSVSSQQESHRNCYIRIMFNVPGTPFSPHDANTIKFQSNIYVREAYFRCKDPRHLSDVVQQIKTLRRQVTSRESEKAERATLVSQEKLQLAGAKFKPIRLSDLWIRPVFGGRGRKLSGTLEAHANGFRYSTSRSDERVDIMYVNVKHAFFQPAEKEMVTLLHFHLHNHIMVGNKKTKDVQFFVEVIEVVQTLGSSKRSAYDPDEIEEEQRERDRKNKINTDFQNFVNRTNELWGQPQFKGLDLEFDQPFRDLGFNGVPHKSSAFVVPTSSCLVELIETPFVVITLNEIEIVNLERVGLGQKNFDMTIVFKDFKRDVFRIDSIPSTSLDGIKEWLDTTDLKYYESRLNLNWRPILKTITEDPEKFIEDGGWEFLNMEASDSDSENSQESDHGYEPSDGQSDQSESEDEDDSEESLVESDEEEEEEDSDEGSEEDKGKTWEELEKEASKADREKGAESDSEEERKRRKIKTSFGKARVPDRRSNTSNHHRGGGSGGGMAKRPKFR